MGKIFKAEVISYNQHMFDKDYGVKDQANGYTQVKVGDIVAIKSVKKSNVNVENEALVLKEIKRIHINSPVARFANLYDEWDQNEEPICEDNLILPNVLSEGNNISSNSGYLIYVMEMQGDSL